MLFRYPGGKSKIKFEILSLLNNFFQSNPSAQYREPFFGGGSIGLNLLKTQNISSIWINDFDSGIAAIWTVVLNNPEELKDKINSYIPSVNDFFKFKEELKNNKFSDIIELAFKKIVIHQISYSGLGTKSGGPLGGIDQESKYKINCRWSAKTLNKNIDNINKLLKTTKIINNSCTDLDFEDVIEDNLNHSILYLDPPYYLKGTELYQCAFSESDHIRLSKALQNTGNSWVLSYDDQPEIRKLYNWANIKELDLNYTINTKNGSRNKKELLISNIY